MVTYATVSGDDVKADEKLLTFANGKWGHEAIKRYRGDVECTLTG